MVNVQWKDQAGRLRRTLAKLEDISLSGACLQFDQPVLLQTDMRISYPKGELMGTVRYCVHREIGYFLGIEFEPGSKWSARHFRPQHMLDPRRLAIRSVNRASKPATRAGPVVSAIHDRLWSALGARLGEVRGATYPLIGRGFMARSKAQQSLEGSQGLAPAIVAKDEFVEINLELTAAHPVIEPDEPLR
jgi:hypothetical protein